MPDANPYPKSAQLARGERRYRRKVASPKQWQAIITAKRGRCRVHEHVFPPEIDHRYGPIQYHHLVSREDHGDDVRDNIVPVCEWCHGRLTKREASAAIDLLWHLTDAEYAYMIQRGGEDYPERAYGIRYGR